MRVKSPTVAKTNTEFSITACLFGLFGSQNMHTLCADKNLWHFTTQMFPEMSCCSIQLASYKHSYGHWNKVKNAGLGVKVGFDMLNVCSLLQISFDQQ